MQYRKVANLTATLTQNDFSVYSTYSVPFVNARTRQLKIPASQLEQGVYYQFRLGYPFATFTYYTNTLVAKTFDETSPFVSELSATSTSGSISVSWKQPEFSEGLFGYTIVLLQVDQDRRRNTELFRDQVSFVFGSYELDCLVNAEVPCLTPFSDYEVLITVLRESGLESQSSLSVRTLEVAPRDQLSLAVDEVDSTSVQVCIEGLSARDGIIQQIEFVARVLSSANDAVTASNISQLVDLPVFGSSCFPYRIIDVLPRTRYAVAVRASTVAGFGNLSVEVTIVTPSLDVSPTFPPVISRLSPLELLALGLKSGFSVSWVAPININPALILRFEVFDDGLPNSPIYNGTLLRTITTRIVGSVRVRTVTIGGIGALSEPTEYNEASSTSSSASLIGIIIAIVIIVVIVIAILLVVGTRYIRHQRRVKARLDDIKRRIPPAVLEVLEQLNGGNFVVPRDIAPSSLTFLDTLGEGKFGAVMKAVLDEQSKSGVPGYLVAVKMVKEDAPQETVEDMKLEAAIMAQFVHPNVVGLIGQVSDGDLFLLVVQYCEHGSLLSWLVESAQLSGLLTLMNMAVDVAAGMAYLASLRIVHRDLAARNVLVSSNFSCKVSDFGLSRQTEVNGKAAASNEQVAICWAAPEVLVERRYSTKSDVWSFGILLFEIFAYGAKPYEGWTNKKVIQEVRKGGRLEKPLRAPDMVYQMMLRSWNANPDLRPDFETLTDELREVASNTAGTSKDKNFATTTNKLAQRLNAKKQKVVSSSNDSDPPTSPKSGRQGDPLYRKLGSAQVEIETSPSKPAPKLSMVSEGAQQVTVVSSTKAQPSIAKTPASYVDLLSSHQDDHPHVVEPLAAAPRPEGSFFSRHDCLISCRLKGSCISRLDFCRG